MSARDRTDLARHALEQVCSGSDASAAVGVYSPDFHDHVNAREYHGHEGIRQSLGLYQLVFSDGDLREHPVLTRFAETKRLRRPPDS